MKHFLICLCLALSHALFAQNSTLWGNTFLGGAEDAGFIFKMNLDGSDYEIVHELDGAAGGKHFGAGMLLTTDGLLYGLTSQGGDFNRGLIYSVDPKTNAFQIRHHFEEARGFNIRLVQASNGNLYGVSANGVGEIFEFNPANDQLQIVHRFERALGAIPLPEDYLIEVSPNVLYGITPSGGDNNDGVLFAFDLETMTYEVKYHFAGTTGESPLPGLLLASDGHLYGVCDREGEFGRGVLFKYNIDNDAYEVVAQLTREHVSVNGGLVEAGNGKFYGTAAIGGEINEGGLFEFDPSTGVLLNKVSFTSSIGVLPDAALMLASNGLLYGMTRYGGSGAGLGMVYTYNPESEDLEVVQSLNDGFPLDNVMVEIVEPVVTHLPEKPKTQTRFFPNPTHRFLSIESRQAAQPTHLEVMNSIGKNGIRLDINQGVTDLEPLRPGLHLLRIFFANGSHEVIKVIKY